jgi:hypothetical protein
MFDLCEAAGKVAGYDGEIVDLWRREAVKATFFCRRQVACNPS